jgi:hypothetical protein
LFAVFAVLFYGVMANVCYTGGWLAELLVEIGDSHLFLFGFLIATVGVVIFSRLASR